MPRSTTFLARMAVTNDGARKPGHGLKGQFFDVSLSGVDVFIGPNDSGKSTRLVLPYVVALGLATTPTDATRPYLGDLPERTSGVLELELVDGSRVEIVRDLSAGATSKINRQCALDVARYLGTPPTRWDLRDFAGGTDSDRSRVVDAVVKAGGDAGEWTVARVVSLLPESDLLTRMRSELAQDIPAADWLARAATWSGADGGIFTQRNAAHDRARSHLGELEDQLGPEVEGDAEQDIARATEIGRRISEQEAVLADVERARAAFDGWIATEARLTNEAHAAHRRLTLAEQATVPTPPALEPIEQELAQADARLAEATAALAAARALVIEAAPADCAAEEHALAEAQATLDQERSRPLPEHDDLRAAVEAAQARLAAATTAREQTHAAVRAARNAAVMAQAAVPDPALVDRLHAAEAAREATRSQIAKLGERLAQAQARLDVAREGSALDAKCIYCGGADPLGHGGRVAEAEESVQVLAEARMDLEDLLTSRATAELAARKALDAARVELAREVEQAREAERAAMGADNAAIATATAAERDLTAASRALDDALAFDVTMVQQRIHAAERAVDAATARLAGARTFGQRRADSQRAEAIAQAQLEESRAADQVQAIRGRLAQARRQHDDDAALAERQRLEREAAAVAVGRADEALVEHHRCKPARPGSTAEVEARIEVLRAEVLPILARQQARVERAERLRLVEVAQDGLIQAARLLDEVKALRAGLDEVKATMAAEAYLPLERAGNLLLAGLPFALYVQGPSDFGTLEDGVAVPFWALGGGRERVVAAAMAFAFAVVSKAPWRPVAIDDLETIRSTWRWMLLENLVRAQREGLVSNVLCTWQSEVPVEVPEGVTVHALGMAGERRAA